jgi:hypothetical protein
MNAANESFVDRVKAEARMQVAAARGIPTDPDGFIDEQVGEQQRKAVRCQQLSRFYGPNSSGKEAQDLFRRDPDLYHKLKAEAATYGLVPRSTPPPPQSKRTFMAH